MGRRDRHGLAAHPFSTSSQVSPLQLGDVGVGAPRPATGGVGGCVACALQPPHGWSARRSGWNSISYSRRQRWTAARPIARCLASRRWRASSVVSRISSSSPSPLLRWTTSCRAQPLSNRYLCPTSPADPVHPGETSLRVVPIRPAETAKVFAPVVLGGAGTPGACTTKVPCGPHCRAGPRRRRYGSQERTLPTEEAT